MVMQTLAWISQKRSDRRWIESPHSEPDAKRQLPKELRDGRDILHHTPCLDDPEQDGDTRSDDQRTADEPQHGHGPRHQGGTVHQVAQHQPVPDADDEAGSEQARPFMERDQRLTGGDERSGIRARSLLAQRHYRKDAEDAYGDEGAFNDTSRDVSKG